MARANRLNYTELAFWCLALSVALLPLGFGGDRTVALGLAQMGLSFSCLFLISGDIPWNQIPFFRQLRWALWLLGAVILWALFQVQPFVPASWVHPIWQETAFALQTPVRGGIAVAPEQSLKSIADLVTYIAGGLLAYIVCQEPARAKKLVQILWLSGVVVCIYGMLSYAAGLNKILWFDKTVNQQDLTATFVNPSHFALYAGLVFICGMALLFRSWEQNVWRKRAQPRFAAMKEWLMKEGLLQGILLLIVFFCIVFSHSGTGLALTIFGVCGYFFFYQIHLKAWRRTIVAGVFIAIALIIAVVIAAQVFDRVAALFGGHALPNRIEVYRLVWYAVQDNPWLGYGLKGFEPEFRLYQQNMNTEYNYAQSDFLECMLDLGVPFALLLWTAIGLLLSGLWHGLLHRRQNGLFPILGLAASLMVLGSALTDFSLQIPGLVLVWAALLGAGLAQSRRSFEKRST